MDVHVTLRKLCAKGRKLLLIWLVLAVLVAGFVCVRKYAELRADKTVSATVSFGYQGIENGLDPSGNRFDAGEMKSAAVIANAAANLGLEADDDTIGKIRTNLYIQGVVPGGMIDRISKTQSVFNGKDVDLITNVSESSYFSNQYTVTFHYAAAGYGRSVGYELLNEILASYRTWFYEQYGYNDSVERSIREIDFDRQDYADSVELLTSSLPLLQQYLQQISDRDTTRFVSPTTGYTFSDLVDVVKTIQNQDIIWISSYIEMNNVTKDREELIDYYRYKIADDERAKTEIREQIATLDEVIENYTKTEAVIPGSGAGSQSEEDTGRSDYTVITQHSAYYDDLISQRIAAHTELSLIEEEISRYTNQVTGLLSARNSANSDVVEERLRDIDRKLDQLLIDTKQTAQDYYETVLFENGFNVLSTKNGTVSLKTLWNQAKSSIAAAELLLFGICLLAALLLVLFPSLLRSAGSAKKKFAGRRRTGNRSQKNNADKHSAAAGR